eukprot:scaffold4193_cov68-Cylindrotheca_fusiformis.AAC.2
MESQESSRQGRNGDGHIKPSLSLSSPQGKEVAVSLQKSNHDSEDATPPSNHHRLLAAADSFWEEVDSFDKLDGATNGGYSVSISGDGTFLAAAPGYYAANNAAGIVQFFQKQAGGNWEENADLRLEGNSSYDYFGSAVSLSNDGKRVAIGAKQDDGADGSKSASGSVSVYDIDSTGKWKEPQVIHGENAGDLSGTSVALSKDGMTLAIGAPLNDGNGSNSGHVRVRKADGDDSFTQIGDDIDGEVRVENFGWSVALSEDGMVLAVGAPYANNTVGRVRVYEWDKVGKSWEQRGSNIDGNAASDNFGNAVDLSDDGDIVAVAAYSGKYAKVFGWKDDDDDWQSIDNDTLSNLGTEGYSVSLATPPSSDSTILAVGTYGGVYTYKLSEAGVGNQTWEKLADEIPSVQVSLSSNGKTLAVGDRYGD